MGNLSRRSLIKAGFAASASISLPRIAMGQSPVVLRWASVLATSHPEVQMMERLSKNVRESTSGAVDIQIFPAGQLGSPRDTIEATRIGVTQMVNDGGAQFGQFSRPLTAIEAPYIWRDQVHMRRGLASLLEGEINQEMVPKFGLRIIGAMYNGKRHITSNKPIRHADEMLGFKLRIPEIEIFRAMAEAWGAKPTPLNITELYLALSQGAVDGQENPLPTIFANKLHEVQKFVILSGHIITPRLICVNEAAWQKLLPAHREAIISATKSQTEWQDNEIIRQETELLTTFTKTGVTIIEPDVESFRKPVLNTIPQRFEARWGRGLWERIQTL